jgi:DNA-binding transcriptional LysR family regulator
MDRTYQLRIFAKVVETGGFTNAANDLGIPRSTVSTVVRSLERSLGSRLLFRTTRKVSPTNDGAILYRHCVSLLDDLDRLEGLFAGGNGAPTGRLRVDASSRIARKILAPALPQFFELYPGIELDFRSSDRIVDLIEESVDCVIRLGPLTESRLVSRKLGELERITCASPGYLARHGTPESDTDLSGHFAVNYLSPTTGRIVPWEVIENGKPKELELRGRITVNNGETYVACALSGLGLIQIPALTVGKFLDTGRLVEVLPDLRPAPLPVAALYPHREHLSPRLMAFLDWATPLLRKAFANRAGPMVQLPPGARS